MTYLLISVPFLVLGLGLAVMRRHAAPRQWAVTALVLLVLVVLIAIFDNLMIRADLFGYGEAQRLGPQVGLMPVEDLFYPLFAALVVPAFWPGKRRSP